MIKIGVLYMLVSSPLATQFPLPLSLTINDMQWTMGRDVWKSITPSTKSGRSLVGSQGKNHDDLLKANTLLAETPTLRCSL